MRNYIKIILFIFFISLFVNVAFADWQNIGIYGDWGTIEYNRFITPRGQYSGEAIYQINISNFEGYHALIGVNEFANWKLDWWHWDSYKDFDIIFNFTGSSWNASILLHYNAFTYSWLNLYDTLLTTKIWVNGELAYKQRNWSQVVKPYPQQWNEVFVYLNNSQLYICVLTYEDAKYYTLGYIEPQNVGLNADNVTLTLQYLHKNVGVMDGFLNHSFDYEDLPNITEGYPIPPHPFYQFIDALLNTLNKVIPQWLRDALNTIWGFFTFAGSMFLMLLNLIGTVIPFLGFIVIFWVLDAGIRSFYEGSFEPIGYVVITIWDIIRAIYQTIANVAEAIWNFIKFW